MLKHSLIALLIGFSSSEASALPVQNPAVQADQASSPYLLQVNHREWRRDHHGDRRRYRNHHYRHYHGGYWYANPWWVLPFVGAGVALSTRDDDRYDGYGSRHVAWCLDRYRSYDARTNSWVSYSGRVLQCVSPYGP